ncbi:MAG: hypothetical protein ACREL7_00875 [Longimicrobiales bacterium]
MWRAGAAVLGAIRGFVQASDSTVYVLDRSWYKIVAFQPDGQLKDVILGGYGEGPGEMRLPVHIGLMDNGDLVVLDYELQRLSFFRPNGGFLAMARIDVPGPMRLLPAGTEIWVTRALTPGSESPRAIAVDRGGRHVREAPPLSESEIPFGSPVNLALTSDGGLILPHMGPGLWDVWRDDEISVRGVYLFPGLAPPLVTTEGRVTSIGSPEAWTVAVASLADGRVLLWYNTASLDAEGFPIRESVEHSFVLFDSGGRRLGAVAIPPDIAPFGWSLYVSPVTGHLLIASNEPYPSVLELRLDEVSRSSASKYGA